MELNTIQPAAGAKHAKRRVGRGIGRRAPGPPGRPGRPGRHAATGLTAYFTRAPRLTTMSTRCNRLM